MMEEIIRIKQLLKIPIERIITFPDHIEIISANQNVGSLPYIIVADKNEYDKSEQFLYIFWWNSIYFQNIEVINALICDLLELELDEFQITIGVYRRLYIKNKEGNLICGISCSYINGNWTIEKTWLLELLHAPSQNIDLDFEWNFCNTFIS